MKLTIRFLGRELLLVDLDHASHGPAVDTAPTEPEHAHEQAAESPFGFWGGSGGNTELAYSPYMADCPIATVEHQPAKIERGTE